MYNGKHLHQCCTSISDCICMLTRCRLHCCLKATPAAIQSPRGCQMSVLQQCTALPQAVITSTNASANTRFSHELSATLYAGPPAEYTIKFDVSTYAYARGNGS